MAAYLKLSRLCFRVWRFCEKSEIGLFLARCLRVFSSYALRGANAGLWRFAAGGQEVVDVGDEEKRRGWSPMMSDGRSLVVACGQGKGCEYEVC